MDAYKNPPCKKIFLDSSSHLNPSDFLRAYLLSKLQNLRQTPAASIITMSDVPKVTTGNSLANHPRREDIINEIKAWLADPKNEMAGLKAGERPKSVEISYVFP
jgi:hypothetical protein